MSDVLLRAKSIFKSYNQGMSRLEILKGVDLEIRKGDSVCIVGESGSGKSTLLHILGTLDRPDRGELSYRESNLLQMSDDELATFRNEKMGFVFQFHHLLKEFTAIENVMMPLRIAGIDKKKSREQAFYWLEQIGVSHRAEHNPNQLSGGELQRVAIARALVRNPEIIFADEPTGNLDSTNGNLIKDLFFQLKEKHGLTLVIVTHDNSFASRFSKLMRLRDGLWS